jgi:hypothetical protein
MAQEEKKSVRQSRFDDCVELARKAFAQHQIRTTWSDRQWSLMRWDKANGRWEGNHGCDIVVTSWRQIVVAGDIGPMVFAYGSGSPRVTIAWMGGCEDIEYYVEQKARIGMGSESSVAEYAPDVAREDLDQLIETFKENYGEEAEDANVAGLVELVSEAKEWHLYDDSRLRDYLYDNAGEFHNFLFDGGLSIGMVPSGRLIYCHAAIRRLHELLSAQEGG